MVWACEKLHLYIYVNEFEIITDNKAVELIFGNPASKPKARIERWCLRLLPYQFKIVHKPGSTNIADFISLTYKTYPPLNKIKAKMEMKTYFDRNMHTKPSTIKLGDLVLLIQGQTSKSTTVYEQTPFTVIMISGNQATIIRGSQKLVRNVSMLKLFKPQQTSAVQDHETATPKQKN